MTLNQQRYLAHAAGFAGRPIDAAACSEQGSGAEPKRQLGRFLGMMDGMGAEAEQGRAGQGAPPPIKRPLVTSRPTKRLLLPPVTHPRHQRT